MGGELRFDGDPVQFRLAVEARRLDIAGQAAGKIHITSPGSHLDRRHLENAQPRRQRSGDAQPAF
jgi:hypothetical protein